MSCQSQYNLSHVVWYYDDWWRVLTMPICMEQKLHNDDRVMYAFGFKAGDPTELIQAAAFVHKGRWKGWNWTWVTEVVQGVVVVRISDRKGKFIYQGVGSFFNLKECPMRNRLLTPSAAFAEYKHFHPITIVPECYLRAIEVVEEPWIVIGRGRSYSTTSEIDAMINACLAWVVEVHPSAGPMVSLREILNGVRSQSP